MGQAILSASEVETLSRGNMHTDPVAKEKYDIRNSRYFKAQAVKLFVNKVIPAALVAAKRNDKLAAPSED